METRFIYRKNKETIFFNIQLETRFYKSTGIKLKSNLWGEGYPKKVASTKDVRNSLSKWKNQIDEFIKEFIRENDRKPTRNETSLFINNLIKGKATDERKSIAQLIEQFKEDQKDEIHANTKRYKDIHLNHFNEAIKAHRLTITDLTDELLSKYRKHLIKEARENTTTNNYIKTVKSFLAWLYDRKYAPVNLSSEIKKLSEAKKDVIALLNNEIEVLENADLPTHLQNQIDIFLFGCYTALGIQDLKRVKKEMIEGDFLVIRRQKTEKPLYIPLIKEAVNILKKYNYQLPTIADNKGNEQLKVAFKKLGLDRKVRKTSKINRVVKDEVKPLHEVISWHKARKTAITTAIKKGIPIALVMQLSGHSKYETMQRYIDQAKDELKDLMNSTMSKNNHLNIEGQSKTKAV